MHIYRITNIVNGKTYIGLDSSQTHRRWTEHQFSYLRDRQQWNKPLYRAMRKYGVENFTYDVLEECDREMLPKLEQHWIEALDSTIHGNGYNLTRGGDTSPYEFLTEEVKQRIAMKQSESKKQMWANRNEEELAVALTQVRRASKKAADARSKEWIVTSPDGERQVIKSLRGFSRQNDLQPALMHLVATGRQTHHKGWKVEPINGPSKSKTKFARRSIWILQSPDGVEHIVQDLKKFCAEHELIYKQMHKVTKGIRPHHRGWTMKRDIDDRPPVQESSHPN